MQRPHSTEQASASLSSLSDDPLLHELHVLVASHQRATALLIAHLGEVDARRLHVEKGFSSLFGYCVERLHFSEDEACRRIEAARLARRFPTVLALLEAGAVSLTVLGLLKPHLTDENHGELLAGVSGASVRQAKEWLAARFPQPDVPSTIRRQPGRLSVPATAGVLGPSATEGVPTAPANEAVLSVSTRVPDGAGPVVAATPIAQARTRVEPLSSDRFVVKFTASRALRDKLELARDLMRHANPSGELVALLVRLRRRATLRCPGVSRISTTKSRKGAVVALTRATSESCVVLTIAGKQNGSTAERTSQTRSRRRSRPEPVLPALIAGLVITRLDVTNHERCATSPAFNSGFSARPSRRRVRRRVDREGTMLRTPRGSQSYLVHRRPWKNRSTHTPHTAR